MIVSMSGPVERNLLSSQRPKEQLSRRLAKGLSNSRLDVRSMVVDPSIQQTSMCRDIDFVPRVSQISRRPYNAELSSPNVSIVVKRVSHLLKVNQM